MREFNAFEKEVLSKMVPLQKEEKLCRYNLLIAIKGDVDIEKNGSDIQIVSDTINKNEIKKILVQLSFLFMYLESNYYLLDFKRDIKEIVSLNNQSQDKKFSLKTDRSYTNEFFIFIYNCFYELLLSETIVDLVNNDFKTVEQRRFDIQLADAREKYKTTLYWTRASFIIALIAALAAILIPILVPTKINRYQLKEIKQRIKEVKTEIHSTNPIKSKDTLNVNIVNKDLKIK